MREIRVIGQIILSDEFSIDQVDSPHKREDDISKLRDMGVSQSTLDGLKINQGTEDIVGQFKGEKVGIEAKGITKKNYGNFKYWGKGMINQMAQLDDKTDADSVGIAIPDEVSETLRGILSSYHSTVSEEKAKSMPPQELYGERQTSILRQYSDDDYVILVDSEGVDVQKWNDFFGISRSTSNNIKSLTPSLIGEIEYCHSKIHPNPDQGISWIRFYYDNTEQMGVVTRNDAPPKLYQEITKTHIEKMMSKVKHSMTDDQESTVV